jgi:hypothetical protein
MTAREIDQYYQSMIFYRLGLWLLALIFAMGEFGKQGYSHMLAVTLLAACIAGLVLDFQEATKDGPPKTKQDNNSHT